VTWSGRCSRELQRELISYLDELAGRSEARICLAPGYEAQPGARPIIERFDCAIPESIELDLNIFEHSDGFERFAAETSISKTEGRAKKDGLFVLNLSASKSNFLARHEGASIYGISFQVYGVIYPHEDRISFIFLNHPENHFIDGHVIDIYHRTKFPGPVNFDTINTDWYACRPEVHLRYHLEEWFDHFLSWVKYFFIPDLHYWRYEPLAGYARFKQQFEELERAIGRELAQRESFDEILESFASTSGTLALLLGG
jgi:hypothetical protein